MAEIKKKKTTKKKEVKDQDKLDLEVDKREVFGKKIKKLRREGNLPANVYGEDFKSQAVTVDRHRFSQIFKKAGETQIIYLQLSGQKLPTLIHNIQKHPVSGLVLHVDFRKVNLKKKVETEVPIRLVGESPAVEQKKGVLLTPTDELKVEALPDAIPSQIEIDISSLKEVGDEIRLSDLKPKGDYAFKDDANRIVVNITEHVEEKVEEVTPPAEEVPAEEAEAKEEKAEEEKKEEEKEVAEKKEKG